MDLNRLVYTLWGIAEGGKIPDDTRYLYGQIRTVAVAHLGTAVKNLSYEMRDQNPDTKYNGISMTTKLPVKENKVTGVQEVELKNRSVGHGGLRNTDVHMVEGSFSRWNYMFVPIPQEAIEMYNMQDRIPKVIRYYLQDNCIRFLDRLNSVEEVIVSQKFTIPASGKVNEQEDKDFEVPDEVAEYVLNKSLSIILAELRAIDKANDGVPDQ